MNPQHPRQKKVLLAGILGRPTFEVGRKPIGNDEIDNTFSFSPDTTAAFYLVFIAIALLFNTQPTVAACTWYVSAKGSDIRDGTSAETAFQTLKKAAANVRPGDTVLIGDGVYTNDEGGTDSSIVTLDQQGSPALWTTWKAAPGTHPDLRPTGWNGIFISGSYIILEGLKVTGANDSIALIDALADEKKPNPDAHFNTNGISIDGRKCAPDKKPNHIIIRNCTICKCPGCGVGMIQGDHLTVQNCRVFGNAWFNRYAASGITTLLNWAHDDDPGYHVVIQGNLVWDNKTLVPWEETGKLSDGNGILLDVSDGEISGATNPDADAVVNAPTSSTPAASEISSRPDWKGRALIANNISAYNGGSGIHTFRTKHVDIINNTTYWNGSIVNYQELFPNRSDDIVILNNIIVPRPGGHVTSNYHSTNVYWDYNIYPVEQDVFAAKNDSVVDPHFMNVQRDLEQANFRLCPDNLSSLARGTEEVPQSRDVLGNSRTTGKAFGRGAYQQ